MADDDDYMSDKFIMNTDKSIAPSLIMKHSDKRMVAVAKRKATSDIQNKKKKLQCSIMEREKRVEGLSAAISSNNKGFEMIMKMGYKPGQGIGRNESGRSEPIPMNIKTDRSGLGIVKEKSFIKKVDTQREIGSKSYEVNTDEFRNRVSLKNLERLMEIDLIKCQIVCEQLDIKCKVDKPLETWYWPTVTTEKNMDDENPNNNEKNNDDHWENESNKSQNAFAHTSRETYYLENNDRLVEISTKTKLDHVNQYLREFHAYCIWCGTSYNDQIDLKKNCPGNTRTDH